MHFLLRKLELHAEGWRVLFCTPSLYILFYNQQLISEE
jgi:hypothetical protein